MTKKICPGQDTRYWRPGDIFDVTCGGCGLTLEFFKDEATRKCPQCGTRIKNPHLALGCAQWCEHAQECLGFDPKAVPADHEPEMALVDKLIAGMKRVFGADRKRIDHAFAVLGRAREIIKQEKADPKVVMASALLHDIGIQEAERKHGSAAGVYRELEGPAIAKPILEEVGLDPESIEHVLKIIANHHTARDIDTPEFRILWDADWLVNIPEEFLEASPEQLQHRIDRLFKTQSGREKAYQIYLGGKAIKAS
jgi:HD superfamily phosphodiesterase